MVRLPTPANAPVPLQSNESDNAPAPFTMASAIAAPTANVPVSTPIAEAPGPIPVANAVPLDPAGQGCPHNEETDPKWAVKSVPTCGDNWCGGWTPVERHPGGRNASPSPVRLGTPVVATSNRFAGLLVDAGEKKRCRTKKGSGSERKDTPDPELPPKVQEEKHHSKGKGTDPGSWGLVKIEPIKMSPEVQQDLLLAAKVWRELDRSGPPGVDPKAKSDERRKLLKSEIRSSAAKSAHQKMFEQHKMAMEKLEKELMAEQAEQFQFAQEQECMAKERAKAKAKIAKAKANNLAVRRAARRPTVETEDRDDEQFKLDKQHKLEAQQLADAKAKASGLGSKPAKKEATVAFKEVEVISATPQPACRARLVFTDRAALVTPALGNNYPDVFWLLKHLNARSYIGKAMLDNLDSDPSSLSDSESSDMEHIVRNK